MSKTGNLERPIKIAVESKIASSLASLRNWVEHRNWSGFDPYDGLNSPILRMASLGLKYARIAAIQFMKKSPLNFRRLLLVKPGHNPKGLGLFLNGYAKIFRATGDESAKNRAGEVIELLKTNLSEGYAGNCWGYNFDWQSRAFFVPKGTPTIVNTSFIAHALLDAYEYCGLVDALDVARSIPKFLMNDLNRTVDGDEFCFSYTPIDKIAVHNANLLGASVLIRLQKYEPNEETRQAALASLRYTMNRQKTDGSWWYAEPEYQHWIDSFHTGFNLQSIQYFFEEGEAEEYKDAFDRGVDFYANNFFEADGTAKYYHNKTLPIDVHSFAQAMVFFARQDGKYQKLVNQVADRFIATFQHPDGWFYFEQTARYMIKIPYMRWSQSWAFHALTELLVYHSKMKSKNPKSVSAVDVHEDVPAKNQGAI